MMRVALRALLVTLILVIVTGVVYPLVVTAMAQLVFPHQADGSLIHDDGQLIGSSLIGQSWQTEQYLYGRPSAVDYDGGTSGGSNLGPASAVLQEQISERARTILALEGPYRPGLALQEIPADLLLASGSGLDPDISPEAAGFQAARIAAVRGVPLPEVNDLVDAYTHRPLLNLFGRPRVNVLLINRALDAMQQESE